MPSHAVLHPLLPMQQAESLTDKRRRAAAAGHSTEAEAKRLKANAQRRERVQEHRQLDRELQLEEPQETQPNTRKSNSKQEAESAKCRGGEPTAQATTATPKDATTSDRRDNKNTFLKIPKRCNKRGRGHIYTKVHMKGLEQ